MQEYYKGKDVDLMKIGQQRNDRAKTDGLVPDVEVFLV